MSAGDDKSSDDDYGLERALAACSLSDGHLEGDDLQKRKNKEDFIMFVRVLMKYIEQKDPQVHAQARHVIRDCTDKSRKKEPGYKSIAECMETRLRATVGDQYWTRAERYYLTRFQKKMQERNKTNAGAGGG